MSSYKWCFKLVLAMKISIKEKSFIARIASKILHEKSVAVVIGKTIHLWNADKKNLLKNKKWLRHELVHIQQFRQHGLIKFLLLYAWESLKNGYYNNKFEVAARAKENDETPAINIQLKYPPILFLQHHKFALHLLQL